MKKSLRKCAPLWYWKYPLGVFLAFWLSALLTTSFLSAQTVVVTGDENNVNIEKIKLVMGSERFEQVSPTGNTNPVPGDVPVLIESVLLENGEEIFVTSRRPKVTNPNPVLGTEQIATRAVEIINSNKPEVGHRDDDFLLHLEEVVSTADLRSYWSIGSQPSISSGESFVDLLYPFPSSGYIMFSERNGNSSIDFIPLGLDGRPVPGATTVQVRGYQWNTGVSHVTDNPDQKQWLVVFSASLFNTLQPVAGVRVVSINEPDGKLVFFIGDISAAPDYSGAINNITESKGVLNILENDEINKGPVQRFDVDITVITPFPDNTVIFNNDGTVDVPAGTPAGVYTMTYQITDVVGGESAQSTATVRVFEMMPEANDDNAEATADGASALIQVLDNDWINGEPATLNDVNLSEINNSSNGVLTLNADGTVDVVPGAASGTYQLTYQICDKTNSEKCDTAVVTLFVNIREIDAVDDNFGSYNQNGVLGNVLINDRINGIPITPDQVGVRLTDTGGLSGLSLSEEGVLSISGRVAPGAYVLEYELSEAINPTNTDLAKITFTVRATNISTINDEAVTNQNEAVTIPVLANDETESGAFNLTSIDVTVAPSNGNTTINADGTIHYSPTSNFSGEDRFTYRACDSEDGTACGTAVVLIIVRPIAIELEKSVDQTTVAVGETLTYTVSITNNSAFAVENVVVEDLLPDLLLYASSSPAPAQDNTWVFPQMAAGESFSMTIDAVAVSPGEVINTVTLTIGEFETSAESPSVTIGQLPVDLKISKTSNDAEIYQGNEFDYVIRVENAGTSDAIDVTVTDNLPTGLSYISSSFSASSNEIEPISANNGNQLTWNMASFPAGETLTITLKVQADQIGVKTNTVEVTTAEQEELNPADNTAQDTNEVLELFIPNVITPGDKDNKNDEFIIKGIERFASSRLVIFNRWGNHVFESDNYKNNWDAQGLVSGSYFYVLELIDSNGQKQTFKGWVQVIKD